jgi:hypothetical protein
MVCFKTNSYCSDTATLLLFHAILEINAVIKFSKIVKMFNYKILTVLLQKLSLPCDRMLHDEQGLLRNLVLSCPTSSVSFGTT